MVDSYDFGVYEAVDGLPPEFGDLTTAEQDRAFAYLAITEALAELLAGSPSPQDLEDFYALADSLLQQAGLSDGERRAALLGLTDAAANAVAEQLDLAVAEGTGLIELRNPFSDDPNDTFTTLDPALHQQLADRAANALQAEAAVLAQNVDTLIGDIIQDLDEIELRFQAIRADLANDVAQNRVATFDLFSLGADAIPGVGTLKGLYEIIGGQDPLSGRQLDAGDRVVAAGVTLLGVVPFGRTGGRLFGRLFSGIAESRQAREVALESVEKVTPKIRLKGVPDTPEEAAQAARSGDLVGPGEFDFNAFPENFSQGVEGTFTPLGGSPVNISLKSFQNMTNIGNLNRQISRNAAQILEAERGPAILIAEPTNFTAEQLADFVKDGPIFNSIIQEGVITRIILRAKDGIVEITLDSVVVR